METSKIRVKVGTLEVEYEGDSTFIREGFLALISDVVSISKQTPTAHEAASGRTPHPLQAGEDQNPSLTIGTIAAYLKPDGPQDLAMCALARIQIIEARPTATKAEIFEQMKCATSYFKSSMARNFPRDLARMVKAKKINEISSGTYSLTAASRQELEATVAGIS